MAKPLIAVFVTASAAGHIPSTATNTGFYFQSSTDSLHEKGERICKPTKLIAGLHVGSVESWNQSSVLSVL